MGPTATSLQVSSRACNGPLRRPRLASQFAMPGPDWSALTWRQPWANMTMPTQTLATSRAKLAAFTTAPASLARRRPPNPASPGSSDRSGSGERQPQVLADGLGGVAPRAHADAGAAMAAGTAQV